MKKTMKLAGITASVVIGSGFATGREIKTYFTEYGNHSYLIIAVVTVLLYLGMLILLNRKPGTGKIFAVPYVFFGYVLMLAALGQLVQDYTSLPAFAGVAAGTVLTVLGLKAGFSRFTVFSGVVSPFIAVALVGMMLWTGVKPYAHTFAASDVLDISFSTVKFVGYNFLSALIILPEIGDQYSKKQKLLGTGLGVLGLALCMLAINWVFLQNYNVIESWDMPLIQAIFAGSSSVFGMVALSLLCFVMVLSLCGSAVGIARMIAPGKKEFFVGLIFALIAVPLSMLGFGPLMDYVYPVFGLLGAGLMLWIGTGVCPPACGRGTDPMR